MSLISVVDRCQNGNRRIPLKSRLCSSNTKENVRRAALLLVLQSLKGKGFLMYVGMCSLIDGMTKDCPSLKMPFCLNELRLPGY